MNGKDSHIPFSLLADLVEHKLEVDEQTQAHLASCSACAGDLTWLRRVIGSMRADRSQDAPAEVVARAKRLFRDALAARRPNLRARIVAALSFDSATMRPAFGVRAGAAAERQLLFSADAIDVDLRLAPSGADWAMSGQILGAAGGRRVELRGAAGTAAADINALGEFTLPAVAAGRYTLTLHLDDRDVDIPELEIGT